MVQVLVVEDDVLIALDLAMMIEEEGHEVVGPFHDAPSAVRACESLLPDFALLDYNLAGHSSEPVADCLLRHNVRFAFLTGHGPRHLPPRFQEVPVLQKPISGRALADSLRTLQPS